MPLFTGQILNNRYRIVKLLGQGGFGAVYRAWDMTFELPCALKENIEITEAAQRQFLREAKLLRTLRHPNLPQVTDYFIVPGQGQYLVMDFVAGEDLQEILDRAGGLLSEAQGLPYISQVCDALTYLHSQNPPVIHRDIKPANIKITPEGKAMLVDFGIAKEFDPNLRTTMGARAVTSGYSPPEQYGRGVTDAQSDVYALGATLYHLLTSQAPPDSVDIVTKNATHPSPAQALNPAVSSATSSAIEKAMRLDRGERWISVQAFKAALASNPVPIPEKEATAQVMPVGRTQISGYTGATSTALPAPRRLPWVWIGIVGLLALVVISYIIRDLSGGSKGAGTLVTNTAIALVETTQSTPVATNVPIIIEAPTATEVSAAIEIPTATIAPTSTRTPPIPSSTSPPPTQIPATLSQFFTDDHGVKMALVPAGEFQMGSENGDSDEKPVHMVYLDAFYIDVYKVTNILYAQCVQAGACSAPDNKSSFSHSSYYGNSEYNDYPVIYVNWQQAENYCKWRLVGLPTEAQWEKAARGASDTRTYPWGDGNPSCTMANSWDDAVKQSCVFDTSRVGNYPAGASPYGALDMAGNVSEWVNDRYQSDYYSVSPSSNPPGPTTGSSRVLRGGGWDTGWDYLRVSNRNDFFPDNRDNNIGFRCASIPTQLTAQSSQSPAPTQTIQEPALTNTPQSLAQIKTDSHDVKMALVPAGGFQMGFSTSHGSEKPVHSVSLDAFYMDVYEVTNASYSACLSAGACTEPGDKVSAFSNSYYGNSDFNDYPVIFVDWEQAKIYCEWRGGRLPTEAQWEKAARGGQKGKDFPWGYGQPVCQTGALNGASFADCRPFFTKPVGNYSPNGYGLFDMAGNVSEWVNDWYQWDYYSVSPAGNPQGPATGTTKLIRGGSFANMWLALTVALRVPVDPGNFDYTIGFRCAVPPGP